MKSDKMLYSTEPVRTSGAASKSLLTPTIRETSSDESRKINGFGELLPRVVADAVVTAEAGIAEAGIARPILSEPGASLRNRDPTFVRHTFWKILCRKGGSGMNTARIARKLIAA
jgi:hypothetical protein